MTIKLKLFVLLVLSLILITACGEQAATTTPVKTDVVKLPKSGQTLCYDASGATISCTGTAQDGDLLKGGAWANPRFTDQSNGTMLDNNTGLIWIMDTNAPGPTACTSATMKNWQTAIDYVKCLNTNSYLGFTDWRLPNVLELGSLINTSQTNSSIWLIAQGFTGVQGEPYWSSTSAADGPSSAWAIDLWVGAIDGDDKSDINYVWPVRYGVSGSLARTGQTLCYDYRGALTACEGTGQDGDTLRGSVWTNSRFANLSDGTIQDHLTDLVWSKDANVPGPAVCNPAMTKSWQAALDYVKCLNSNSYLGFTDWRLPNRNELSSLVDYAQLNQAAWLAGLGFTGVQAVYYWSSSSSTASTSDAWGVDMGDGDIDGDDKSYSQYVWPVRSGS
jgi:hypothetical protein